MAVHGSTVGNNKMLLKHFKIYLNWTIITLNVMFLPSDQIRPVAQSCPTLCDPMNHSTPGLPVHHQLQELTQTHVHQVSDAIQSVAGMAARERGMSKRTTDFWGSETIPHDTVRMVDTCR